MKRLRLETPPAPQADPTLPLINIVFLLLIFVMLSGVIRAADPLPLEPASAPVDPSGAPAATRTLHVAADGRMAWNGLVDEAALEGFVAAFSQEAWDKAWLKADRNAEAAAIIRLTERLRAGGITTLTMIVEARP
ncbi:MAG: biopolymer transporter ExbD [Zhengella sp.]|uniref:ExbD/TolR family protein n=1 Tax=Zhengella sp. TaxID=2282762 RepID=UPI001DD24D03|nr:biopolymer transporter ExbD [Notoacmeibacter sp.]MCC0028167.1 biopolymer transporter ExbD [Brucellaceae bacterium]